MNFFQTPEQFAQLHTEAKRWLGTPFVPHARILGAGVDCVNLCAEIYLACGFLDAFHPPPYVMDGGKHNRVSQLTAWLDAHGSFTRVWQRGEGSAPTPLPGDLLCFKLGRSAHHTGLVIHGPHFVHCLYARDVQKATLADQTFQRLLAAIYRPVTADVSPHKSMPPTSEARPAPALPPAASAL